MNVFSLQFLCVIIVSLFSSNVSFTNKGEFRMVGHVIKYIFFCLSALTLSVYLFLSLSLILQKRDCCATCTCYVHHFANTTDSSLSFSMPCTNSHNTLHTPPSNQLIRLDALDLCVFVCVCANKSHCTYFYGQQNHIMPTLCISRNK